MSGSFFRAKSTTLTLSPQLLIIAFAWYSEV